LFTEHVLEQLVVDALIDALAETFPRPSYARTASVYEVPQVRPLNV